MEYEDNVSGDSPAFDVGAAFFGPAEETEIHESPEDGTGTPPDEPAPADEPTSDDEHTDEGDSEQGEQLEVWEFNGNEYNADQVSDALKHKETFERFNTSISPLIDNIKNFGQVAERLQVMAATETEKQITELKQRLGSGLDSREYQQTHQMLQAAEMRMNMLTEAAGQEMRQRQQALQTARAHNARQVATNLVKAGWTKDQMNEAQAIAQGVMKPEQFADLVSPEFMAVLRDAAELRANKASAAARLQDKVTRAVRVNNGKPNAPGNTSTKAEVGSPEWINANFWGGK